MIEEQILQQKINCPSTEGSLNFSNLLKDISQQQLEQVLQFISERNQIEVLDLSNNQLGDNSFLRVLELACTKPFLQILNFNNNNISDYSIQHMVSKLLVQNMLSDSTAFQLHTIKLIGNSLSQIAMRSLSGITWIRKKLKIYVLEGYLPYAIIEKNKYREIFKDGTLFLDSEIAYQKAKTIEQNREIFLAKVQIPAHAIDFEKNKDILSQTTLFILPQFKNDLIIDSTVNLSPHFSKLETAVKNDFIEKYHFKKQNCSIALEYLFRSIKHLEHILENRLNQLDMTKDGKQYLLIQFLLGKQENKQQSNVLNIYRILQKVSELKQKQVFQEELIEVSKNLFEISNYIKKSMQDSDFLLKEFHDFIENILSNLFIKSDEVQKQEQLKRKVFPGKF